jgi:hypothetical protein
MNTKNFIINYSSYFLVAIIAYAIGGQFSDQSTTNRVLRLCNEKVAECKFKYDILRYNEEGVVPPLVKPAVTQPAKK